ncbi:MAG: 50S ribosomal protein L18 [Armatimonadetes bacterium]|nr:50S ribosomal protein L18 [Armatimonadota bacterium]
MNQKESLRIKRHRRVRGRIAGTAHRPRLNVYRSLSHIYAQLIDDDQGCTLVAISSVQPAVRPNLCGGGNIEGAKAVGKLVAQVAIEKGIQAVVFDRGGYKYHGRVRALAEGARESGLRF